RLLTVDHATPRQIPHMLRQGELTMATGYTYPLHDGTPITFEQFALNCSRAMGAAIHQRDDNSDAPITEMTVDDYYATAVAKAEAELLAALDRSDGEWANQQTRE